MDPADVAGELTDAQRRALLDSDPATGQVGAGAARTGLLERKLAARYGNVGAVYLNAVGRDVRSWLQQRGTVPAEDEGRRNAPRQDSGAFVPALGGERVGQVAIGALRGAEVATAWAGVLEGRRVSGDVTVPASWEQGRIVRFVALALEAAGITPGAVDASDRPVRDGYRVAPEPEEGSVRVEWRGPAGGGAKSQARIRLEECRARLEECGWDALVYQGRGTYFLLATAVRHRT